MAPFQAAPFSMAALHFLMAKTDGRDRFARVWMFGMKLVRGLLYLRIKKHNKDSLSDITVINDETGENMAEAVRRGLTAKEVEDWTSGSERPEQLKRLFWWAARAEQQVSLSLCLSLSLSLPLSLSL